MPISFETTQVISSPIIDLINNSSIVIPRSGIDTASLTAGADGKFTLPECSIIGRTPAQIAANDPYDPINTGATFSNYEEIWLVAYALSDIADSEVFYREIMLVNPWATLLWYALDLTNYDAAATAWLKSRFNIKYQA